MAAQFAAFAQTWPCRVLKIIQGVNCPMVAPSGVLLSRAGAAPSTSESQENGFRKHSRGKAGVRATCTQAGGRAGPQRRGQLEQGAVPWLRCQKPGLELPPLCKQRGHRHQRPPLMEQIGLKGKQSAQRKQHMAIWGDLLGETRSCSRCSLGKFCL